MAYYNNSLRRASECLLSVAAIDSNEVNLCHSPVQSYIVKACSCLQKECQGEPSLVALFTFVARHPVTKQSAQINPVQPQTSEEHQLFQERQQVADSRRQARSIQPPAHQASGATAAISMCCPTNKLSLTMQVCTGTAGHCRSYSPSSAMLR